MERFTVFPAANAQIFRNGRIIGIFNSGFFTSKKEPFLTQIRSSFHGIVSVPLQTTVKLNMGNYPYKIPHSKLIFEEIRNA